ncbi:MAG TPA: CBS domain-containing protein [Parachlamydiaceae bacterium]|nr:CBS domain-containing protein [Parachlamydiaceae bacterium]
MAHLKHHEVVKNIMTTNPKTIHLATPISEVGKIFSEGKFHHLPVVNGKELIGIVSYFDLIRVSFEGSFGVSDEKAVYSVLDRMLNIETIMTKDPFFIQEKGTIREAAEKLSTGKFHSLPVVNEDHELVGIVTSKDLIDYLISLY